jgi:hypothetical protein
MVDASSELCELKLAASDDVQPATESHEPVVVSSDAHVSDVAAVAAAKS